MANILARFHDDEGHRARAKKYDIPYEKVSSRKKYEGLRERTIDNVAKADGTLLVVKNPQSGGSVLTRNQARAQQKAFLEITMDEAATPAGREKVTKWLKRYKIKVLNVAGNRESKAKGIEQAVAKMTAAVLPGSGVKSVISGGQEGADIGALVGAREAAKRAGRKVGRANIRNPLMGMPAGTMPMVYEYGKGKAMPAGPGAKGAKTTFEAVSSGARTGTTRKGFGGAVRVGAEIDFTGPKGEKVRAIVTEAPYTVGSKMTPEQWAAAEGYELAAVKKDWDRISKMKQIRYSLVGTDAAEKARSAGPIKPRPGSLSRGKGGVKLDKWNRPPLPKREDSKAGKTMGRRGTLYPEWAPVEKVAKEGSLGPRPRKGYKKLPDDLRDWITQKYRDLPKEMPQGQRRLKAMDKLLPKGTRAALLRMSKERRLTEGHLEQLRKLKNFVERGLANNQVLNEAQVKATVMSQVKDIVEGGQPTRGVPVEEVIEAAAEVDVNSLEKIDEAVEWGQGKLDTAEGRAIEEGLHGREGPKKKDRPKVPHELRPRTKGRSTVPRDRVMIFNLARQSSLDLKTGEYHLGGQEALDEFKEVMKAGADEGDRIVSETKTQQNKVEVRYKTSVWDQARNSPKPPGTKGKSGKVISQYKNTWRGWKDYAKDRAELRGRYRDYYVTRGPESGATWEPPGSQSRSTIPGRPNVIGSPATPYLNPAGRLIDPDPFTGPQTTAVRKKAVKTGSLYESGGQRLFSFAAPGAEPLRAPVLPAFRSPVVSYTSKSQMSKLPAGERPYWLPGDEYHGPNPKRSGRLGVEGIQSKVATGGHMWTGYNIDKGADRMTSQLRPDEGFARTPPGGPGDLGPARARAAVPIAGGGAYPPHQPGMKDWIEGQSTKGKAVPWPIQFATPEPDFEPFIDYKGKPMNKGETMLKEYLDKYPGREDKAVEAAFKDTEFRKEVAAGAVDQKRVINYRHKQLLAGTSSKHWYGATGGPRRRGNGAMQWFVRYSKGAQEQYHGKELPGMETSIAAQRRAASKAKKKAVQSEWVRLKQNKGGLYDSGFVGPPPPPTQATFDFSEGRIGGKRAVKRGPFEGAKGKGVGFSTPEFRADILDTGIPGAVPDQKGRVKPVHVEGRFPPLTGEEAREANPISKKRLMQIELERGIAEKARGMVGHQTQARLHVLKRIEEMHAANLAREVAEAGAIEKAAGRMSTTRIKPHHGRFKQVWKPGGRLGMAAMLASMGVLATMALVLGEERNRNAA